MGRLSRAHPLHSPDLRGHPLPGPAGRGALPGGRAAPGRRRPCPGHRQPGPGQDGRVQPRGDSLPRAALRGGLARPAPGLAGTAPAGQGAPVREPDPDRPLARYQARPTGASGHLHPRCPGHHAGKGLRPVPLRLILPDRPRRLLRERLGAADSHRGHCAGFLPGGRGHPCPQAGRLPQHPVPGVSRGVGSPRRGGPEVPARHPGHL